MARGFQQLITAIIDGRDDKHKKFPLAALALTDQDWDTLAETVAVLEVVRWATTIAQLESACTGGYRPVIEMHVEKMLKPAISSEDTSRVLDVIDWRRVASDATIAKPPKKLVKIVDLSDLGTRLLERAFEEAQTRHSMVNTSQTEVAAMLLDPRLVHHAKDQLWGDEIKLGTDTAQQLFVDLNMAPLREASQGKTWRRLS